MRLLVLSDIHLEFGTYAMPEDLGDFDVAVFAGDIARPLSHSLIWLAEQRQSSLMGAEVIFVPGNHEFYHEEILGTLDKGREMASRLGIHMLAPGCVEILGTRFVGGILWTDYGLNGNSKKAQRIADQMMNDHRLIRIRDGERERIFTSKDAAQMHSNDLDFITRKLSEPFDGRTVVVTHHAPHPGSVQPRFKGDELTPAFTSNLSRVIKEHQPSLWIHGHDHGSHDYMVEGTRVLSNQAGYPTRGGGRENRAFNPRLIVEIPPSSLTPASQSGL